MTAKKNETSRQLGLKISGDAYEALERRAKGRGLAPTALARWYVLDQIGMSDQFAARKRGTRRVVKPLNKEMKQTIALLRELQLIRTYLERLLVLEQRRKGAGDPRSSEALTLALSQARQLFLEVLNRQKAPGK